MKVLVTGHNGYIGSVMVPLLQQAGHHPFVAVNHGGIVRLAEIGAEDEVPGANLAHRIDQIGQ